MSIQTNKWRCCACTYENWPASLKCVLCGKAKNSENSINSIETPAEGLLDADNLPTISDASIIRTQIVDKWRCLDCTYENWPKNAKCVMCFSIKPATAELTCINSASNISVDKKTTLVQDDSLWFDACSGVILNNTNPVEKYLVNEKCFDRKLSTEVSSDFKQIRELVFN